MHSILVIIPVFRGYSETRACIESVLAANCRTAHEVLAVDDASPEPALSEWLAELARVGRLQLQRNPSNLGFVCSVNRAMQSRPEADVVLLNSDTCVTDGWLDRLADCAARNPDAASVCPFSNNATLASYPRSGQSNALPPEFDLQRLSALFARCNAGVAIDVPTTVGFCMYLRRGALEDVGLFDEQAFGTGYGEENDWCLRAAGKGYRHLIAADGFVFHEGEVSFAAEAAAAKAHAEKVMAERHPGYAERIAAHFAQDPAREARRAVDLARLAVSELPNLLFITHHWGGGTEQHILDLAGICQGAANVLVMRPHSSHAVSVSWCTGHDVREEFQAFFENDDREELLRFLRGIQVARVHLHHVHGHAPEVLELARDLGAALDVTLHDYWPLTPQYHLDHGGGVPQREIDHPWGWSLAHWRSRMQGVLASAARVICPSQSLADTILRHYPGLQMLVWPHPEPRQRPNPPKLKVLILGGLTRDKGQDVVLACARDAAARGLPLHFRVLGHTEDPLPTYPDLPLSISGSFRGEDLETLIGLERADVAMFPAQIPESFSFTLSAALRSGLPVVASRLGAFVERLSPLACGRLLDWNASSADWNAALMAVAVAQQVAELVPDDTLSKFRTAYLEPIATAKQEGGPPRLGARHYFAPRTLPREAERTLADLYAGGVECGHGPTREELKRRVAQFDRELVAARESRDAAQAALKRLQIDYQDATARFQAAYAVQERAADQANKAYWTVVESRTWRMTAPIRGSLHQLKQLRQRLSVARQNASRLPQRTADAAQLLREQGAAALGKRIYDKLSGRDDPFRAPLRTFDVESAMVPLQIKQADTPRWSIIIPVYGQHILTYTCLKSIAETCRGMAIEVLVADDCSSEPANEALSMVSGPRFLRNSQNLGFLQTCNGAARAASGEFLVFLNNDTVVTQGWLQALDAVFVDDAKAGMAGAKLLFADGLLQEAGGIVWRDGSASNYGRGEDPRRPEFNYRREVDYCSGACIMVPKALWQQLGGFDERFVPAYYEDTDLAFRIREAGFRVIYQPRAEVAHFEGKSSGTDLTQGVKRHQVINQQTFEQRWRTVLAVHRPHGLLPQLERDRNASRRVLVIDTCLVMPDRDSGSLRMFEMLKAMRELGCRVSFVPGNGQYIEQYAQLTQSIGVEVLHHPFVTPVDAAITRYGADFDVVILSRATVAIQHIDIVKKHMPHAKLIFDTVDLHFLRQAREAELSGDPELVSSAERMKAQELDLIARSDVTLVVSPFERDLLKQLAPRAQVHIVSNIHEPAPGTRPFSERSGLVFIGGFRHPPNVDAMLWFAGEVLPLLRQSQAGIRTTVIGSDVPDSVRHFAAEDFVIAGFVPDVEPLYNAARIAIAPLRYGAGVKGKVNLAMQFGVPVVATSCSIEGMNLADGRDVLKADSPREFADAVLRLYGDEALWMKLRQGGIDNIAQWFSRANARRALKNVLDL